MSNATEAAWDRLLDRAPERMRGALGDGRMFDPGRLVDAGPGEEARLWLALAAARYEEAGMGPAADMCVVVMAVAGEGL